MCRSLAIFGDELGECIAAPDSQVSVLSALDTRQ